MYSKIDDLLRLGPMGYTKLNDGEIMYEYEKSILLTLSIRRIGIWEAFYVALQICKAWRMYT